MDIQFESFKSNMKLRRKKGYTAMYKPGFIKVLFIDNDSVAMKQYAKKIKFPKRFSYSTDIDFLEDFAEEIGGKLVYPSKSDEVTKSHYETSGSYIIFEVPQGKELDAIKKAEKYGFVIDTDLIDEKGDQMSNILQEVKEELEDLVIDVSEISDEEIDDKMDELIDMLNQVKKINKK